MAYYRRAIDRKPVIHHEANKERSKTSLGKPSRSLAEDESEWRTKKLQQISKTTDLSSMLTIFNSLSMPRPGEVETLETR
jgi:hypothetical protein